MLAGFAGIIEGIRIGSFVPLQGSELMFFAVAAAVIGGTALFGGSGTVIGAFLGALVLGMLRDGLSIEGVSAFTFNIVLGAAIIAAMILNAAAEPSLENEADVTANDAIRAEGIGKGFGPVTALRDVSIHLGRVRCSG